MTTIISDSEPSLKQLILNEIKRLSSSKDDKDFYLVNNILRPMVLFIDDHNNVMEEMARIGSKHSL